MAAPDQTTIIGRKASKEVRRQQLIEATIDVMARKGYSGTTMFDVAKAAGLSSGIGISVTVHLIAGAPF